MAKFTLVYVLGPANDSESMYMKNIAVDWVKIGKTDYEGSLEDLKNCKYKIAQKRLQEVSRTGLPFVSRIYDVFVFPYLDKQPDGSKKHTDNIVRDKVTTDIQKLATSVESNKEATKDERTVRAGKEFVYNVRRRQIYVGIESYQSDLLSFEMVDKNELATMAQFNKIAFDEVSVKEKTKKGSKCHSVDWDKIVPIGATVVFYKKDENGQEIKVTYIGSNQLKYEESDPIAHSTLATMLYRKLVNPNSDGVNGNRYWLYNGEKIEKLVK